MTTKRTVIIRIVGAAAVLIMHTVQEVDGFSSSLHPASRIRDGAVSIERQRARDWPSSSCLRGANGSGGDGGSADDEVRRLREKADGYRNEAERLRLALGLRKIDMLERDIRDFVTKGSSSSSSSSGDARLQELRNRVEDLVRGSLGKEEADAMLLGLSSFASRATTTATADGVESSSSSLGGGDAKDASFDPPTDEEADTALSFIESLPPSIKNSLAIAAGYDGGYDSIADGREFVRVLCRMQNEEADALSAKRLRGLYRMQRIAVADEISAHAHETNRRGRRGEGGTGSRDDDDGEEYEIAGMSRLLATKIEERLENTTRAMELFPRSLQDADEGILPTLDDANVVFQLLEKSFMATERPMKVRGGYIIRGTNKRKSAGELLDALDGKILKSHPTWMEKYQINYVEIYSDSNEELFEDAILITPNRFVPIAPGLLNVASTAIAVFSTFVFCIDAFGENPVVMERLREATGIASAGGTYDLVWFNELLVPLLVTLGAAQGVHELSHLLVAWSKQVSDEGGGWGDARDFSSVFFF
jgi:hypothetical protein